MENYNAKKSAVSREEAQTVLDKIRSVIVREVGCEEKDVVLDACWRDDLGADSLDMAYVMMEVDKLLEIHIDENDGWDKNSTLYETLTRNTIRKSWPPGANCSAQPVLSCSALPL